MIKKTLTFDAAEHLTRPEAQAKLLADAYASGNDAYVDIALATVVRARKSASNFKNSPTAPP